MKTLLTWISRILDFLFPRFCLVCGCRLAAGEEHVCCSCLFGLPRTGYHLNPYDNPMARCFWGLVRNLERVAAYMYYYPHSRETQLILQLKYHHQPDIGIFLGRMMATDLMPSGFFDGIDLILPLPLTRNRKRARGYNQSEMLARGISSVTGIPVDTGSVRRVSFRQSQTRLQRWDRIRNVAGAYRLNPKADLSGRHVLLVDDVCTTGSTLTALAEVLDGIPSIRISILVAAFARTSPG